MTSGIITECWRVKCINCGQIVTEETIDFLYAVLVADGWEDHGNGYECPMCSFASDNDIDDSEVSYA
jgi:hypothetical protein